MVVVGYGGHGISNVGKAGVSTIIRLRKFTGAILLPADIPKFGFWFNPD